MCSRGYNMSNTLAFTSPLQSIYVQTKQNLQMPTYVQREMPSLRACPKASWSVRPSAVGNSRGIFVTPSTQSHASLALFMSNLAWLCRGGDGRGNQLGSLVKLGDPVHINREMDNNKNKDNKTTTMQARVWPLYNG